METNFEPAAGPADENRTVNEIKNLIADVEDLLARIANFKDEDVARLRAKIMRAVSAAKEGLAGSTDTFRSQAQQAMSGADDYVRESPWVAVGIAAAVGAVVGILVARRS
ncbi:MAG TPA: DUF883 family protein [Steroidobacteraceae bacterium]|nr:DUF883 family protein [Steroidobacteraceae bacterium]